MNVEMIPTPLKEQMTQLCVYILSNVSGSSRFPLAMCGGHENQYIKAETNGAV